MANVKRLLKLADFLETVPRKALDLSMWVKSKPTKPEGERPGDCGFAGCAMGWASHAKLYRGLGWGWTGFSPNYHGATGWAAAQSLFRIDEDEARHLFSMSDYTTPPTPKQVAKRIRKFVEAGQ